MTVTLLLLPRELLTRAQLALRVSQAKLGELIGVSRRTIVRWVAHGAIPSKAQVVVLARAVYPGDAKLAEEIAAAAGETLESLALVVKPPPAAPRPAPALHHMMGTIVCAAAEALDSSPKALRPALLAAFKQAAEMGLTVEDVCKGLGGAGAKRR
jgi:hypothetical protein